MKPVALIDATDSGRYGGKAAALAAALRAGLPVPEGHALSVELVDRVAEGHPDALRAVRGVVGGPVAVRSSAVGEDGARASFAGQHTSVMAPDDVVEAVRTVRASGHADSALAYRRRVGIEGTPRVAVVLQRLVAADVAGVLFTVDPVSGNDVRVIEASWGLGEAVVDGKVDPDRYRVARGGRVLERSTGGKEVVVRPAAGGGTTTVESGADEAGPCLTDADLRRLDALASRCEAAFDGASDIEWALADGSLYLLQRRPVTAMGS